MTLPTSPADAAGLASPGGTSLAAAPRPSKPLPGDGSRISAGQNDAAAQMLLAARFNRYEAASFYVTVQFWVMAVATVGLALLKIVEPSWSLAIDFFILFAVFIELFLDEAQEIRREQAATVQEKFDRELYGLPWSDPWVEPLSPEDIARWASEGQKKASIKQKGQWRDWYASEVARLPLSIARLACQRSNAWWDRDQRRAYGAALLGAGAVSLLLLLAVAIGPNLPRAAVRDSVIVWLPLPYWLIREGLRHRKAAKDRDGILKYATAAVKEAIEKGISETELTQHAEGLQSALYRQRRAAPMVWSWFYQLRRPDSEAAMRSGVADVAERWANAADF